MQGPKLVPVKVIETKEKIILKDLLKLHGLLEEVESGNRIILFEGKSLSDLNMSISPGNKIAVIAIDLLAGG